LYVSEKLVLSNTIVQERLSRVLADDAMRGYDERELQLANQCRFVVVYVRAFVENGVQALEQQANVWDSDPVAARSYIMPENTTKCKQIVHRRIGGWIYSLPSTLRSLPNSRPDVSSNTDIGRREDDDEEEIIELLSLYDQNICINEGGLEKAYTLRNVEKTLRQDPCGKIPTVPWLGVQLAMISATASMFTENAIR